MTIGPGWPDPDQSHAAAMSAGTRLNDTIIRQTLVSRFMNERGRLVQGSRSVNTPVGVTGAMKIGSSGRFGHSQSCRALPVGSPLRLRAEIKLVQQLFQISAIAG